MSEMLPKSWTIIPNTKFTSQTNSEIFQNDVYSCVNDSMAHITP